jgi:hypothetical protein
VEDHVNETSPFAPNRSRRQTDKSVAVQPRRAHRDLGGGTSKPASHDQVDPVQWAE